MNHKKPKGDYTYCANYYVGGENAIKVLSRLLPYLVAKHDQALKAIERRKLMKRKPNRQHELFKI